ncbi:MAG: tol-pal system protein YbgF [Methylovirgula sp.]
MAHLKRALAVPVVAVIFAVIFACTGMAFGCLAGQAEPALRLVVPDETSAIPASGAGAAAGLEIAQSYGMPPENVGGGGDGSDGGGGGDASLVVRIGQLEEQVRQLNGKVEQLQFANHQLEDQMRKFQQDVEFQFQELPRKGGAKSLPKRSEISAPASPSLSAAAGSPDAQVTPAQVAPAPRSGSRDDAFDPTKDPNAPGAPRILGAVGPQSGGAAGGASGDVASNDDAPIDLLSSPQRSGNPLAGPSPQAIPAAATTGSVPPLRPSTGPGTAGFTTTPGGTVIADTQGNATKEEFDIALGYLKQKDYENAERSFAAFIAKNPKNRRASDALYYLGETYYQRGRQREAAEQYLKISTNYASSPRAPEAMLRLGEALHALGAKEQACATFSEIPHKYPNASAAIKAGAEREAKRAQC